MAARSRAGKQGWFLARLCVCLLVHQGRAAAGETSLGATQRAPSSLLDRASFAAEPPRTVSTRPLNRVALAASGQVGLAVGARGNALITRDGGLTWSALALGTKLALFGVALSADGRRGYIVGDEGLMLVSTDSGATWRMRRSETPDPLYDVAVSPDGMVGVAVGWEGSVIRSVDGGATWKLARSVIAEDLIRVAMADDASHAFALAQGVHDGPTLLATSDAGASWRVSTSSSSEGWGQDLSVDRTGQHVWVALAGPMNGPKFQITRDGGRHWQELKEPAAPRTIEAVETRDGQHIWAASRRAAFFASSDGGRTFAAQTLPVPGSVVSIAFAADQQRGVIVDDRGVLAATTDGGRRFQLASVPAQRADTGRAR